MSDLFLPNDVVAERAVLASALLSGNAVETAADKLTGEEFYNNNHRLIFQALKRLYVKEIPLDAISIKDDMTKHGTFIDIGFDYIVGLLDEVANSSNVSKYIDIVRDKYKRRLLILDSQETIGQAMDDKVQPEAIVADMEKKLIDVEAGSVGKRAAFKTLIRESVGNIAKRQSGEALPAGIPTGFKDIDKKIGGLKDGEYIVIAARPSIGKSTLMLNMAYNIAITGKPVYVFSIEMTAENLVSNMVSHVSGIDNIKIRDGKLTDEEMDELNQKVADHLYLDNVFIDDESDYTITDIHREVRRLVRKHGPGTIFIDYIQLMTSSDTRHDTVRQVSDISKGIKNMAKKLRVPVVALSQLNRNPEARASGRPMLSDLRGSGSIEQDCDVAILLNRPEHNNPDDRKGQLGCYIVKNRNGPTGFALMNFDGSTFNVGDFIPGPGWDMEAIVKTWYR